MAKRKKRKSKKKVSEPKAQSNFWHLSIAILFFVIAFFLLLGAFGTGGSFPEGLFDLLGNIFGYAAYTTPVVALLFGIWKFTHENNQIPLGKLMSTFGFLFFFAGFFHVLGADEANGGGVGSLVGGVALQALDVIPAAILLFVFTMLMFFLVFGISPKVLLKVVGIFKRPEKSAESQDDKDNELANLKRKSATSGFKLNEGVPVAHGGEDEDKDKDTKPKPRLSSLKNSAKELNISEQHAALTVASDPDWQLPSVDLLDQKQDKADAGDVEQKALAIGETFQNFNIDVEMEGANIGPRVTQYTLKPPTGVKLTKITALENNLALDLAAHSIRIEAPIPGKRLVGIEVPNRKSATVRISSLLQTTDWKRSAGPLSFVIGKDIAGSAIIGDLAKMPHMMIAGQTGSGKSVMINTVLTSLLYRNSPSDLKLILVDPKQVELAPYEDMPHLLTPVINEPEKCISALKWAVAEMERRYKELATARKRNIKEYNAIKQGEAMPYIVIVIDELADLMMMAARDVEALIVRIAQKARAVGIHLVLATQRPSVDVITGLIKANVPARIAFTTASQVDSRTIIDQVGAEKLLGQGDMLFLTADMPKPKRVQGAFISDDETVKVTDFIREQRDPNYDDEVVSQPVQIGKGGVVADYGANDADDDMYNEAVRAVVEGGKASTSMLQRRLRIGYGRAARLIETMEEQGIISPADGNRPRDVLVSSMDEVFGDGPSADSQDGPDDTTIQDIR